MSLDLFGGLLLTVMDGLFHRFVGLDGNNMTLLEGGDPHQHLVILCTREVEFYSTAAKYEDANERIMRIES